MILNPNSDGRAIGVTSRVFHQPSDCGVSSDLQALKLSESGVSPSPRNNLSTPPPISELEGLDFSLLSKEEREIEREKLMSQLVFPLREARKRGFGLQPHEDPGIIWRKERGLPVPEDFVMEWKPPDSDDLKDEELPPVIPYIAPDVLECEICGRGHYESCCPYLFEIPPGGVLRNTTDYIVVCECGEIIVDGVDGRCPNQKRHDDSFTRRVVPNDFGSYTYSPMSSDADSDSDSLSFPIQGSST